MYNRMKEMGSDSKINNEVNKCSTNLCQQIKFSNHVRQLSSKHSQTDDELEAIEVFSSPSTILEENSEELITTIPNACRWKFYANYLKLILLICIWIVSSVALMTTNVKVQDTHQISIPENITKQYLIFEEPKNCKIHLTIEGSLMPQWYSNMSTRWLNIWIELWAMEEMPRHHQRIKSSNILLVQNISEIWIVPVVSERLLDSVPEISYTKTIDLKTIQVDNSSHNLLNIKFNTNLKVNLAISMSYNLDPIDTDDGIIYAGLILFGLYVLIIFELLHRTLAAMLASTMSIAILAALNARPTMTEIISWINVDTLLLLFSMMTIVTISSETGVFDYMSVIAYKITGGKIWPLINTLCLITAVLSCFLDNVTTALLITPVTIKLCEVMKLNPIPILIYMIIFTNIGGAITPIGDPPNFIIASNSKVIESGVNFATFTLHMAIGGILALAIVYLQLRLIYNNVNYFKYTEQRTRKIQRELDVWKRTAASLSSYSKDEENVKKSIMKQQATLIGQLKYTTTNDCNEENYNTNLIDLQNQYPIKDKILLIKCGFTLLLIVCVFFLHSIPAMSRLGMSWTSLLGALLLLLLYDKDYIEGIFSRIEWSTLLFFASLFILMEALARLGLIEWIGRQTQFIIMSVGQESRLTVAIILILWVSGFASAFVDNLPLTTMMIRIATNLADNGELGLPLQPLIWALSFGACFGGNGTLFGSSSNIVCAGVAEQHGYKIGFLDFMKVGFPVMISSMLIITFYLIICHVVLGWH